MLNLERGQSRSLREYENLVWRNIGNRVDRKLLQSNNAGNNHQQRAERPKPARDGNHRGPTSSVWFTINVGRSKNADPKWLIPLLCRRGNVTKRSIGKIQILARETRVEIATDVAEQFAEAIRRPDPKDPRIHIEQLEAGL